MIDTHADDRVFEFPATPTQEALWFMHQMDPAAVAYNIPLAFELEGALDAGALRAALESLVARHEILRTLYVERTERLVQRVVPSLPLDFVHERRSAEAVRDLDVLALGAVTRPFDLARGGPLRARIWSWGSAHHLLVVVLHHIAVDHSSVGLFARELEALYAAHRDGRPSPLPPLPLQFADYAVWTRDQDLPRTLEDGLAAWERELSGHAGVLNLPALPGATRAQSGSRGAVHDFSLSPEVSDSARAFARQRGLSSFNVLLGALQVLLHQHTGQREIIVGTPFANRGGDERLEQVLGCFINTLPIPVRIDPSQGFSALLKESRRGLLHAQSYQNVPFDAIVERINPHREQGLNPLYQVGFVVQDPPVQLNLDGLRCTDLRTHCGGVMYDLHLWLCDAAPGEPITGTAWYDTARFSEEMIATLAERYEHLLAALVARPDAAIADVPVATPSELALLAAWNDTARAWEPTESVLAMVRAQAALTPDSTAVIAASGSCAYAELLALADNLARTLVAHGVAPGDLVGISVSRDIGMVVGVLGIMAAGAAYVPLDPEYPDDRLAYIARESRIRALVTDVGEERRARARFRLGEEIAVIALGEAGELEPGEAAASLRAPAPDDLMYVIFTSGSTGRPKGVAVPQRCVVNFLRSMAVSPGFSSGDRLLAVTTLSFDIAVLELFLPLTRGGTVVIADADQAHDGDDLRALIAEHGVTVMQATPGTWRLLMEAGWQHDGDGRFVALCGGEPLPASLAQMLVPRVGELWNMYGPTETTVWSTCERVRANERQPITIGRPIANTTCHVLSPALQQLPSGIAGELFIGGAGVTDGYLRRPELTAERFIDDPFGPGRLYRTGDLSTRLADGRLACLGRLDDQVKVNGHRVELGEVESVLEEHPHVSQAAVRVSAGDDGDARLVAYVVAEPGVTIHGSDVRRTLRDRLPDYMVPSIVLPIDALPRTPNGKIDRKALPDPLAGRSDAEFVEPRTEHERAVAGVWRELLGVERVGVLDNFFEIGGHSLLAIRATARLGDRVGVRPDPRAMFFQTLEQVAASLTTAAVSSGGQRGVAQP